MYTIKAQLVFTLDSKVSEEDFNQIDKDGKTGDLAKKAQFDLYEGLLHKLTGMSKGELLGFLQEVADGKGSVEKAQAVAKKFESSEAELRGKVKVSIEKLISQ